MNLKWLKLFCAIAMAVFILSGCDALTVSWKEEVLLHDGRVIVVKRAQNHGGRREIGQPSPVKEHSISFTLPGSNKVVEWKDEFSKEIGHSNFDLLALHILNGTPYIVTSPYGCLSYNKWDRPNPPYVFLKFDGNQWQRISMSELPWEFKNINVVINTLFHEKKLVSKGLVPAEMVKELNSSLKQEEYQTILRTPLAREIDCVEMVFTRDGGWLSSDWFSSQPSLEACLKFCEREKVTPENCPCEKIFKKEN